MKASVNKQIGQQLVRKGLRETYPRIIAFIENLKAQQVKIEIERGETPTIKRKFEFVADTINGDINDKQFQEQVINKLINCVYVADDKTLIYFSFDNENPFISLSDTTK